MYRISLLVVSLWMLAATGQTTGALRISILLPDGEGKPTPVPRHALLISDNPSTAPPRRIVTTLNGTAVVQLRPGNYTVESDEPVTFQGKRYQWTQMIDVAAGRDTRLELTAANADVEASGGAAASGDATSLLTLWQNTVVAIWTPTTHASGFVVDRAGLIVTNARGVGGSASVEVQLARELKVMGRVVSADAARDVAVVWIDPQLTALMRPVPLACEATQPLLSDGQPLFTIVTPLRGPKDIPAGIVKSLDADRVVSEFALPTGSAGGPVFTAHGQFAGITSVPPHENANASGASGDSSVIRGDVVCGIVAIAERKVKSARAPTGAHLPVEPQQPFPPNALEEAARHRVGSLNPYQISASAFDVAFITPVTIYGAQYQDEQTRERERAKSARVPEGDPALVRPLMEFSNWSEYIRDMPSVVLVRVTPKLVEGFWMKVARGAALTQGVSVPPIKRFTSGFSRLRAFCGEVEVTPIHPFKIEQRVGDGEAIYEGLYVFEPDAFGPQCGSVKLELYSEKAPQKGDPRVVDPNVIQQIWDDFAPYRAGR